MYWGRGRDYFKNWGDIENIRQQSQVGLELGKSQALLYMPFKKGDNAVCSCASEETQAFDKMCYSCYGTGVVGGYVQYGYSELVVSSIDTDLILTNLTQRQTLRPYKLVIQTGQLTGSLVTPVFNIEVNFAGFKWETRVSVFDLGNTYQTLFSIDGINWIDMIYIQDYVPVGYKGNIQFKIVLSRVNATDRSPMFEIFRLKWPWLADPLIYVSKARQSEGEEAKDKYGLVEKEMPNKLWTQLNFKIEDLSFIKFVNGPYSGDIYALFDFNRTFFADYMLRQSFTGRRVDPDKEIYSKVF